MEQNTPALETPVKKSSAAVLRYPAADKVSEREKRKKKNVRFDPATLLLHSDRTRYLWPQLEPNYNARTVN